MRSNVVRGRFRMKGWAACCGVLLLGACSAPSGGSGGSTSGGGSSSSGGASFGSSGGGGSSSAAGASSALDPSSGSSVGNASSVSVPPQPEAFVAARAVLQAHCVRCHPAVDFETEAEALQTGWVRAGDPENSRLLRRNRFSSSANADMPPEPTTFSAVDHETLRSWIAGLMSPTGTGPFACTTEGTPPHTPVRRLSRFEYRNTIVDIASHLFQRNPFRGPCYHNMLGLRLLPALSAIPDDVNDTFEHLDARVSNAHVDGYFYVARRLAEEVTLPLTRGCGNDLRLDQQLIVGAFGSEDPARPGMDTRNEVYDATTSTFRTGDAAVPIARRFIASFGRFVFRRPLTAAEVDRFATLFEPADPALGYRKIIVAMLISPAFLYHLELDGTDAADRPGVLHLTDFETAARLSFHFWKSTPDVRLLELAERGELSTPEQVAAAVEEMFSTTDTARSDRWQRELMPARHAIPYERSIGWPNPRERVRDVFNAFWIPWLKLQNLPLLVSNISYQFEKMNEYFSDQRGPLFVNPVANQVASNFRDAVLWEVEALGDYVTFTQDGGAFSDLILNPINVTDYTGLGNLYQTPSRPHDTEMDPALTLNPAERAGILTRAAMFMSNSTSTGPFHRGAFLRRQILCDVLQDPASAGIPPDAIRHPSFDPTRTTRDRYAEITQAPSCASCHGRINGLGFAMEAYDSLGQHRNAGVPGRELYFARDPEEDVAYMRPEHSIIGSPAMDTAVRTPIDGVLRDFDGPVELMEIVASSPGANACFVRSMQRYSQGLMEDAAADGCRLSATYQALTTTTTTEERGILAAWKTLATHPDFKLARLAP